MFRAYDPEGDRVVAVKLFRLDLPPERVHRLVAGFESLIAAELTHRSAAAPLATGIVLADAFLAQEYVEAESLDIAVREHGPLPLAGALHVAAHLAGALDSAALVNILHGALHPRDVLLSSGETRLIGLGVARALEQVGVAAPVRRPYSAPERMAMARWDRRTDVFSLAALMHEMLWGRRVTATGMEAADALTELQGADLDLLRAVFARALAEDPAGRYGTALEFVDRLSGAFQDTSTTSRQSTVDSRQSPVDGRQSTVTSRQSISKVRLTTDDRRLTTDDELLLPLDGPRVEPGTPVVEVFRSSGPSELELFDLVDVLKRPETPTDFDGRTAETDRFQDVESAPAIVAPAEAPTAGSPSQEPSTPRSDPEPSRSAVWPLALALVVGLALGFAGGYGFGVHDRSASGVAAAPSQPTSLLVDGPEHVEGNVEAPAKTAAVASVDDQVPLRASASETALTETNTVEPQGAPAASAVSSESVPLPPSREASADLRSPGGGDQPDKNGRLLVRSTPAGAKVFVDGRAYGSTPLTINELTRGAHRLRLERAGYDTQERRVVITASRGSQSVRLTLSRSRAAQTSALTRPTRAAVDDGTGTLSVESRPSGAAIFIDDRLVGTTPLSVPDVAAGEHTIRLERDGYRRWSSSVRVVANQRNRVTASLER